MTFERTAIGQANRAIFLGVDYTCYVEGVDGSTHGDDIAFWKETLRSLRPDLRIWFLARGGKPNLEKLARNVIDQDVSHTLVAMDADYSRFFEGRYLNDRRVLYTAGYSWENDVYFKEHLDTSYLHFARCQNINHNTRVFFEESWSYFERSTYWLLQADFTALCRKTSVIPRDRPGRILQKAANGAPIVNFNQCYILIADAKRQSQVGYRVPLGKPAHPRLEIVGKLLALAAKYILNGALRINGHREVSSDHCQHLTLVNFAEQLRGLLDNFVLSHHRLQGGRI